METSGSFDQLIKKFRSFSEQTWQEWIWQRCHGEDSIAKIPVVRDPNPEQAVIDAFWHLTAHSRSRFIEGLLNSLGRSLDSFRRVFSRAGSPIFDGELLALERHLRIALGVEVSRLRSKAKMLGREIFSLAMRLPDDQIYVLRPLALSFRFRSGDRIANHDLERALRLEDTFVEAFRHEVEHNAEAIPMYFPKFIDTATRAGKPIAIKMELLNLQQRFGSDESAVDSLHSQLNRALGQLTQESWIRLERLFSELNIPVLVSQPIKEILKNQREGNAPAEIVYADFNYVAGAAYSGFNEAILRSLADKNNAITFRSSRASTWDMAAFNLHHGLYAFYFDPYYMTGARNRLVGIIPLGWVDDFTCVVNGESRVYEVVRKYLDNEQLDFAHIINDCFRIMQDLEVGLLGDTAASTEVVLALRRDPRATERLASRSSPVALRYWLEESPENRMVICDHGVARDIRSATKEQMRREGLIIPEVGGPGPVSWVSGIQAHLVFKYSRRIQVGIVYPKQDADWKNEIEMAVKAGMIEFGNDHWDQISRELAEVGITAYSKVEFQERLGIRTTSIDAPTAEDIDERATSTDEESKTVVPFKRKTG